MSKLLGIELDYKSVKILYGIKKQQTLKIIDSKIFNLTSYNLDNKLGEQIKSFIKINKIKTKSIYLNIESNLVITRNIIVPNLSPKELDKFINFQKQDYFPIDISNYKINYKVNTITEDNKLELVLFAASNDLLNSYIEFFKSIKLKVIYVDLKSNCLIDFMMNKINFNENESILVADIGLQNTNINVISKSKILFSRNIDLGINQVDNINLEINKFIELCNSKFKDLSISKIYIRNDTETNLNSTDFLNRYTSLNQLLIKKDNFNLLPADYLNKLKFIRNIKFDMCKLAIVLFIFLVVSNTLNIFIHNQEIALNYTNLQLNNERFEKSTYIINELNTLQYEFNKYTNILNNLNNPILSVFELIINSKPQNIYIDTININNACIIINGQIDNLNEFSNFIINLETTQYFNNIVFNIEQVDEITLYTIEFEYTS